MSTPEPTRAQPFGSPGGWVVAGAGLVLVAAIALGGGQLPVQRAQPASGSLDVVGATASVCTVGEDTDTAPTDVDAVVARRAPGRDGELVGRSLGADPGGDPAVRVSAQGSGGTVEDITKPLVLTATGAMSTASAAAMWSEADSGADQGLTLGPCAAPATGLWFAGLGADAEDRSELVLSNPDDTQAEVDLRFYGRDGELVVPGSPGIVVPAKSSTTLALSSLLSTADPVSVQVRATDGRVSAMARDLRSTSAEPSGADWHPASAGPSTDVVVPAVPGGSGERRLAVVNPGTQRATVAVQVMGPDGSYTPAGAQQLDLAPQSTGTVQLAAGLAGGAGSVRLTSDQPVTAAVRSLSEVAGAAPDLAVATAAPALVGLGVAPVAYLEDTATTLTLSNAGAATVDARVEVVGLDGVAVSSDDVPVAAGASAIRTVRSSRPVYVTVSVPTGAQVYGGVSLAATGSAAKQRAGLTGMALVSPDLAGRAPTVSADPHVAQ